MVGSVFASYFDSVLFISNSSFPWKVWFAQFAAASSDEIFTKVSEAHPMQLRVLIREQAHSPSRKKWRRDLEGKLVNTAHRSSLRSLACPRTWGITFVRMAELCSEVKRETQKFSTFPRCRSHLIFMFPFSHAAEKRIFPQVRQFRTFCSTSDQLNALWKLIFIKRFWIDHHHILKYCFIKVKFWKQFK